MNETAARRTVLLRAVEREPASPAWSDDDRAWATRAAAQVEGERAADDAFIARRAALGIERLANRERHLPRLLASVQWSGWIGWLIPALAFAAGAAVDSIGADQRINLLAPPLLALLAWNIAAYLLLGLRFIARPFTRGTPELGPIRRLLARLARVTASTPRHGGPLAAAFIADWTQAGARLTLARLGRVLHVSAAAFALGTLAMLYLRGIAFEYRAGWESTFLGAAAVQALLAKVLGPASALTGIALPDVAGYERLRFAVDGGVNAAPWLQLHAVTLGAAVVLPRLLLALWSRLAEARLAARFPLPLDEPYFRALLRVLHEVPVAARVAPYGLQLAPQAVLNLGALFAQAFGAKSTLSVAPQTAFGAEDDIDPRQIAGQPTLLAPLFSLAATPEGENHGAFIDRLRSAAGSARLVAIVDESAFRRQFGDTPRLDERRALWRSLADARGLPAVFVDLDRAEQPAARESLQTALDAAPAP